MKKDEAKKAIDKSSFNKVKNISEEVHSDIKENIKTVKEENSDIKKLINKNTTIVEAMELNPFATEIFMDVGLGCSGCFMAEVETIEQGLLAHGFNEEGIQMVVDELNL